MNEAMKCDRCGKMVDAVYPHTCTPLALRLADDLRQGHFEMATFAADELCRLSAENDALRADAERLDFLAAKTCGASDSERYLPFRIYWGPGQHKDIRAVIDSARSKT